MSLNKNEKQILKEKIRDQRREMWDGDRPVRRPRSNRSASRTTQEPSTEKQNNSDEKQNNSDSVSNMQGTDWNNDPVSSSQPLELIEVPASNELTWKSYLAIALSAATIIGLGFCLGYIFAS